MNLNPWVLSAFVVFAAFGPVEASAGTGIKNGGTAFDCPRVGLIMAESALAMRFPTLPDIDDRGEFFQRVTRNIADPVFLIQLRAQWDAYGDSDAWPDEDPAERNVFWYSPDFRLERFNDDATIPGRDLENPICAYPPYDPERCCSRVLISYFDAESRAPARVPAHFHRLTRAQKNVLEFHEAVYRTAREVGSEPPASTLSYVQDEIDAYLASEGVTGELPSYPVVRLIASLLRMPADPLDAEFHYRNYRQWARAIYKTR